MACKNCSHELGLHNSDEGFCEARVYRQAIGDQNLSVPEQCDCLMYEPDEGEFETVTSEQKRGLIQAIESLLEHEERWLRENGRYWSKRLRRFEAALEKAQRLRSDSSEEEE